MSRDVTGPVGGKKWWQLLVDIGWKTRSLTKWMRKRCQLMSCCNMCCQNWNKNLIVHNIGCFLTLTLLKMIHSSLDNSCNRCWTSSEKIFSWCYQLWLQPMKWVWCMQIRLQLQALYAILRWCPTYIFWCYLDSKDITI